MGYGLFLVFSKFADVLFGEFEIAFGGDNVYNGVSSRISRLLLILFFFDVFYARITKKPKDPYCYISIQP